MINWTITADVSPEGTEDTFFEVNGLGADQDSPHQDVHDPRHYPTFESAISFLITNKCKIGDTILYTGAATGKVVHVKMIREGDFITYDVGSRLLASPADLIAWLATILEPGDTVDYLSP